METIRQYMESLFASLPNTAEVKRAKEMLLEMSEDKYQNLCEEGISDNEAVARVIAEFGNLDELKEVLGIEEEVKKDAEKKAKAKEENTKPPTVVTINDAKQMISDHFTAAILRGIGVACFICCPVPAILIENGVSASGFFLFVGAGVALMVVAGNLAKRWKHVRPKFSVIDYATAEYVKNCQHKGRSLHAALLTIGIVLCATCIMPIIALDTPFNITNAGVAEFLSENLAPALMFIMVGMGVGLLVFTNQRQKTYRRLLSINPSGTISGDYSKGSGRIVYENKMLGAFMNVYWPLVLCLYLIVSFLTFAWWITWIVWPIAGVVRVFVDNTFAEKE